MLALTKILNSKVFCVIKLCEFVNFLRQPVLRFLMKVLFNLSVRFSSWGLMHFTATIIDVECKGICNVAVVQVVLVLLVAESIFALESINKRSSPVPSPRVFFYFVCFMYMPFATSPCRLTYEISNVLGPKRSLRWPQTTEMQKAASIVSCPHAKFWFSVYGLYKWRSSANFWYVHSCWANSWSTQAQN